MSLRVAVVGAGIAGASCARSLADAGASVVVFDKGRVPGGRMAARRMSSVQWDYGAQYFTVRDARFARQVAHWHATSVTQEWTHRPGTGRLSGQGAAGRERWVGVPSMREPALQLLEGLDVRSACRVDAVERKAGRWRVHWMDGQNEPHDQTGFDWLICTAPAPQAAALLRDATPSIVPSIERARMGPTWAVLITTAQATAPPSPTRALGDRIAWLAADDQKPGRSGAGRCFVAHTVPEWSEANVDAEPLAVVEWLRPDLARLLDVPETSLDVSAHRWRFARVVQPAGVPCIVDRAHQTVAAGDWCIEGRVESAYLSGLAAAEAVRTSIRGSTHE